MFDLGGKRALVTGATGGIGAAIARALHAHGAVVALSGTRTGVLAELATDLGQRTHVVPCDLGDADAADALAGRASDAMGGLDIVVNNAGINRDGLAMRMKDDDWQTVLDVNLTAAFRVARASLRGMAKQRWGRIISISSVVGQTGNPGQTNYAAAKAGLVGMSKALALEMATRGVTVNCVAPGFIETAMTAALGADVRATLAERIPVRTLGAPDDVAACVVFLASDEAGYVTGQTLHVNGGMVMV
ncbi:MAG: 3-oxoacyl-[acyl-carrier-protein] reductase [Proteobacteria bacterium]|nr:3-oxoacyl-[acyl-carrier-protein] reductase [Pseudomonadota bacterium]MDA1132448.1 3-oxoacyl-[acyl-carrier-protein] reductase [Pseudomonadota bacterium]